MNIEVIVKYVKGPKDLSWLDAQWAKVKGYYMGHDYYDEVLRETISLGIPLGSDLGICQEFFEDLQIAEEYKVLDPKIGRSMSVGDIIIIKREGSPEKCYVVQHNGWKDQVLPNSAAACKRCAGYGYLPSFPHVEGGVCFRCGGHGRRSRK